MSRGAFSYPAPPPPGAVSYFFPVCTGDAVIGLGLARAGSPLLTRTQTRTLAIRELSAAQVLEQLLICNAMSLD